MVQRFIKNEKNKTDKNLVICWGFVFIHNEKNWQVLIYKENRILEFKINFLNILNSISIYITVKMNHLKNIGYHMQKNIKILTENTITIQLKKVTVWQECMTKTRSIIGIVNVICNKLKSYCSVDFSQKLHFSVCMRWPKYQNWKLLSFPS